MTGIAALLAALALHPIAPPPPDAAASGEDIGVLAHRLKKVRWEFEARNGTLLKCEIKRSSGSARVDALLCEASAQCAAEQPSVADAQLVPCVKDRVRRLYEAR